jgi:hypothetical protein
MKEIDPKDLANQEQLLGIDVLFAEYLLYGTWVNMNAFGQPLVGVALATQLTTD